MHQRHPRHAGSPKVLLNEKQELAKFRFASQVCAINVRNLIETDWQDDKSQQERANFSILLIEYFEQYVKYVYVDLEKFKSLSNNIVIAASFVVWEKSCH